MVGCINQDFNEIKTTVSPEFFYIQATWLRLGKDCVVG